MDSNKVDLEEIKLKGDEKETDQRSLKLGIFLLLLAIIFGIVVVLLLVFVGHGSSTTVIGDVEKDPSPPGPGQARSLELLGMGPVLGPTGLAKVLYNETLIYGDVFQYGVGSTQIVVLGDLDIMKDAFIRIDSFDARRTVVNVMLTPLQNQGSTFQTSGDSWLEIRTFTGQTILQTRYLQAYVQPHIDQSITSLMTSLTAQGGAPFNPEWLLRVFFVDVNHRIYFDHALVYDNDDDEAFVNDIFSVQKITFEPNASMPSSPVERAQMPLYLKHLNRFANHTRHAALAARSSSEPTETDQHRSMVVMYDRYIRGLQEAGTTTWSDPGDGWRLSVDLFFSGHSSIPQVVRWMCLYLAAYMDYQEREINMLGSHTSISYEDRFRVPLTTAFLTEVDRIHHHSPLGVPRYAMTNETVNGFHIGAGTTIISNLWQMSNDPEVWGDPRVFRPERFFVDESSSDRFDLDEEKLRVHTPFGVGLRSCPGEKIARRTIFKTMIALVQEFQIVLPEGTMADLDQPGDFAEPYDVMFINRN